MTALFFDYGPFHIYKSVEINAGPEWLIKIDSGIIGSIDITGESLTPTPLFPQLSQLNLLQLTIVMKNISAEYKQLQTT